MFNDDFFNNNEYNGQKFTENESNDTDIINKKFMDYQTKFHKSYSNIKGSLNKIQDNIINYKSELKKLEDFLYIINEHERNYKLIKNEFNLLITNLQNSIDIEKIINEFSNNQQLINMNEYITLYKKVKNILNFFKNSKFQDKDDFIMNLTKIMYKGFKIYQDAFYILLKRYDQIILNTNVNQSNIISEKEKKERETLLNKIKKLSQCLQDPDINFDFTENLIKEHSNKICMKINEIKVTSVKNYSHQYSKGIGYLVKILIETSSTFKNEEIYINTILSDCTDNLKQKVICGIFDMPLDKIIQAIEDLLHNNKKYDPSNITSGLFSFFHNLDVLDIWVEKILKVYRDIVLKYYKEKFEKINEYIVLIGNFCNEYISNFYAKLLVLNYEKIESENVLNITNDTVFFISNIINYKFGFQTLCQSSDDDINPINFLSVLIEKIEEKSGILIKKYPPLKFLLLINNVYYIILRTQSKEFEEYITKAFIQTLKNKIENYIQEYLKYTWNKIDECTFDDREIIAYEGDSNNLKATSKELIKKKFSVFNETMKVNLKFQQHIQIIDRSIEQRLIDENIKYICKRYQDFYDKYNDTGFTRFRNKYIAYMNQGDVEQDLKLYFIPDSQAD